MKYVISAEDSTGKIRSFTTVDPIIIDDAVRHWETTGMFKFNPDTGGVTIINNIVALVVLPIEQEEAEISTKKNAKKSK